MFVLDDKKELRITIAKDVIEHLESERIIASTSGEWVEELQGEALSQQIGEVLPEKNCRACALGSMFIAAIDRYNECKVSDVCDSDITNEHLHYGLRLNYGSGFNKYMEKYFEPAQLQLIEIAFEYASGTGEYRDYKNDGKFDYYGSTNYGLLCDEGLGKYEEVSSQDLRIAAFKFGRTFRNPNKRLEAIMNNIIENKGEFCP